MQLAEGIRRRGFRKWYERELLKSHACLVLLFVCSIGLLGAFEFYSARAPLQDRLRDGGAIVLFVLVGLWSLRRYLYLLMHAEAVANQAVCAMCQTYGRFTLVSVQMGESPALRVRCGKCQHEWPIRG